MTLQNTLNVAAANEILNRFKSVELDFEFVVVGVLAVVGTIWIRGRVNSRERHLLGSVSKVSTNSDHIIKKFWILQLWLTL